MGFQLSDEIIYIGKSETHILFTFKSWVVYVLKSMFGQWETPQNTYSTHGGSISKLQ